MDFNNSTDNIKVVVAHDIPTTRSYINTNADLQHTRVSNICNCIKYIKRKTYNMSTYICTYIFGYSWKCMTSTLLLIIFIYILVKITHTYNLIENILVIMN